MYKETYINGVKQSEEPIPYSLLEQNGGYSPCFFCYIYQFLGRNLDN